MTRPEIEELLTTQAETFVAQALAIRVREDVMPTALLIAGEGAPEDREVTIAGIIPASERVRALTELVKRTKAAAFLFWCDGYVTHLNLAEKCRACAGVGCPVCRFSGRRAERTEAIVTIAKTVWGFERAVGYPYMVMEGELVRMDPIELEPEMLDEYRGVFGGEGHVQ